MCFIGVTDVTLYTSEVSTDLSPVVAVTQALSELGCSPNEAVMIGDVSICQMTESFIWTDFYLCYWIKIEITLYVFMLGPPPQIKVGLLVSIHRTPETMWAGLRTQGCWEFWSELVRFTHPSSSGRQLD